jgi:Fe2+ or Zn2+ uptake regulation protein
MRQAGFRVTLPRQWVVWALARADRALTPYRLRDEVLASGGSLDVATVYRVLANLAGLGLVHHVGVVDGYLPCGLEDAHQDGSEHVVCRSCGRVVELEIPPDVVEATQGQVKALGYSETHVKLEVLALCPECT